MWGALLGGMGRSLIGRGDMRMYLLVLRVGFGSGGRGCLDIARVSVSAEPVLKQPCTLIH